MKLLILTIIVLVIPAFFAFVFVMSTASKLTNLRNRCRELRRRLDTVPETGAADRLRVDFNAAVGQYNAARGKFPASLIATLCGFREWEPPASN